MYKAIFSLMCTVAIFSVQSASADIAVNFVESAPKDRFEVRNTGQCTVEAFVLKIDLSSSDGRLIFDTTATGAGVDVFQPFEIGQGLVELVSSQAVRDGDAELSIAVGDLPPGASVSFTIDVDDTLAESELGQTRVAGREINNGLVQFVRDGQKPVSAAFGADSRAIVSLPSCP